MMPKARLIFGNPGPGVYFVPCENIKITQSTIKRMTDITIKIIPII